MSEAKLRVGVVGLRFGLAYMETLMRTPRGKGLLDVKAVCDADPVKLAAGERALGGRGCTDLDMMLDDPEVEAVALFTGPVGRAALVRKIVRAGRHVMTTKPFELDPDAAAEALAEAARLGKVVHLNSPAASTPDDVRRIMTWQKKYDLGRPLAAHWQTWCRYREKADGSWYDDPRQCPVAPIFRLGIYALNDLLYFFTRPSEVHVTHSRLFTGRPTPDHALLTVKFADGGAG